MPDYCSTFERTVRQIKAETAWRARAACRGHPIGLFFPTEPTPERVTAAKQICQACQVRLECMSFAVTTRQVGIWGGTDERERAHIRRSSRSRGRWTTDSRAAPRHG